MACNKYKPGPVLELAGPQPSNRMRTAYGPNGERLGKQLRPLVKKSQAAWKYAWQTGVAYAKVDWTRPGIDWTS